MLGQTNRRILSGKLQRTLRNNLTNTEKTLWRVLRGRQISGVKFRRQHPYIEAVKEKIWMVVQERKPHPYPDPPLEGDGVQGNFSQGA